MDQRPKSKSSWWTLLLVAAAVVLWAVDQKKALTRPEKPSVFPHRETFVSAAAEKLPRPIFRPYYKNRTLRTLSKLHARGRAQ